MSFTISDDDVLPTPKDILLESIYFNNHTVPKLKDGKGKRNGS